MSLIPLRICALPVPLSLEAPTPAALFGQSVVGATGDELPAPGHTGLWAKLALDVRSLGHVARTLNRHPDNTQTLAILSYSCRPDTGVFGKT